MLGATKTALVFSGAGSQYSGMCKTLYQNFDVAKRVFEEASDILHINMKALCFEKEEEEKLDDIEMSHVAIATAVTACYEVFKQEIPFKPDYLLGYSLGEYMALYASGAMSFPTLLELVRKRSIILKEAQEKIDGTMNWMMRLDENEVRKVCQEVNRPECEVYVSGHNHPTHFSISGHSQAVKKVSEILESKGAMKYPLGNIEPIHCPLMADAKIQLQALLDEVDFHEPSGIVLANQNGLPYKGKEDIKTNLLSHLVESLKWYESIQYLYAHDVRTILEIGPKDILTYLISHSGYEFNVHPFGEAESMEAIRKATVISKEQRAEFIGDCLKTAISVRNCNEEYDTDQNKFKQEVLTPYHAIEESYRHMIEEGLPVEKGHMEEALNMVQQVLSGKRASEQVIQKKLNHIWKMRVLEE